MKNNMNFFSNEELEMLGLKAFGNNVLISRKCSIYSTEKISIGDNVRIDDFTILSGEITIGNYVHISAYSALYAKFGIRIGNFCGLSPRTIVLSASDDFSGEYMISPMVPLECCNVTGGEVVLHDYVQLGANTIVLPKNTCYEGAVTGAFTLVTCDLAPWSIYHGIPSKKYKDRKMNPKEISKSLFLENYKL